MSHYKILGVSRDASRSAIRAAYLQKAKKYHPDINQSPRAEQLFKAVQEAYQVLNNDLKRRDFDTSAGSGNEASPTAEAQHPTPERPRYKGKVYDPEQERQDFSKEFYEQAEALRREMTNDRPMTTLNHNAKRIASHLFWKSLPYLLFSSISLTVYNRYKRTAVVEKEKSLVLHDMYGRAYITDRFGRRIRAALYDDKVRLSKWEAQRLSDDDLLYSGGPLTVASSDESEHPDTTQLSCIRFSAFDRIAESKSHHRVHDASDASNQSVTLTIRPIVNPRDTHSYRRSTESS